MTSLVSQERRLIELVTAERRRQCLELARDAQEKAAGLQLDAWRAGRERVRNAVLSERDRARRRLELAHAEMQTRNRLHAQRRARTLLDEGWVLLKARLLERWRDPHERHRWIRRAARQALQRLPANGWRIAHPGSWNAEDQMVISEILGIGLERPPEFYPDDNISAGLIVRSGRVALDMTLEGMIADRIAVEARLLALLEAMETTAADRTQAPDESDEGVRHG